MQGNLKISMFATYYIYEVEYDKKKKSLQNIQNNNNDDLSTNM